MYSFGSSSLTSCRGVERQSWTEGQCLGSCLGNPGPGPVPLPSQQELEVMKRAPGFVIYIKGLDGEEQSVLRGAGHAGL